MNRFDLLQKNLRADIRQAPDEDGATTQHEAITRLANDVFVQGKFGETADIVKHWSWICAIPKHGDVMRMSKFTHFSAEEIRVIRVKFESDQGVCVLEFQSPNQLLEFYIPMLVIPYCSVVVEVISAAPPLACGSCAFECYYVQQEMRANLCDEANTVPHFWPIANKRLLYTFQGRAFSVPQLV